MVEVIVKWRAQGFPIGLKKRMAPVIPYLPPYIYTKFTWEYSLKTDNC